MIIYNITCHVEREIETSFIDWMKNTHIKEVLATEKFIKAIFTKIIENENQTGSSYAVQYYCENKEILQKYFIENAPSLQRKGIEMFGQKMLIFRTELDIIEEF